MAQARAAASDLDTRIGLYTALVVPAIVLGISIYATYVVVGPICVSYLLNPNFDRREGVAIAILVIHFLLLFFWYFAYLRLLFTFATNPGFVEYGPEDATPESFTRPLENFYNKEAYVCMGESKHTPQWCDTCRNWKPDRTHHCRSVNRCVRKMDHFCPWVGGCVGETTYKFFVQFLFYCFFFCIFVFVTTIVLVVERRNKIGGVDGQWIAIIALSGFFALFLFCMFFNHMFLILKNLTTIEQLNYKTGCTWLVVRTDEGWITKASMPGENVWDLGPYRNFKEVMGEGFLDWILPIKPSPCAYHKATSGEFPFGSVLTRMRNEPAGPWEKNGRSA